MSLIYKLDNLVEGEILKRPSKYIKSPYVADISLNDTSILGHTASLGCCGLADVGAHILMSQIPKSKKVTDKLSCEYRVFLSIVREKGREIIVGINPLLAETLVENALNKNLLKALPNVGFYHKQTKMCITGEDGTEVVNSRFDFTGFDENGVKFIMEVKNVPLADYEDVTAKERKKMNFDDRDVCSKVAYFPDGYRKKRDDPVSPRALKHINELTYIKRNFETRCIMCYVIQRTDVDRFQPSVIDQIYREAFREAVSAGVEVITMVVEWNREGDAYFIKDDLPISI